MPMPEALDEEDAKLVTLARAVRARLGAIDGAAVRDDTGRTYSAVNVALPSLHLSALQAAIAAAVSSGAHGIEAAAIVSDTAEVDAHGIAAVRDLGGTGTPVHLAGPDGTVALTHLA